MQTQTPALSSSWCGLHQAQQVATQGIQWLFGCLPCVKGHHRIHPTSFESPDVSFVNIEAKKRLRVLHVVPNRSDTPSLFTTQFDQVDADYCSLDSSGEDYWFMRWNRPIRPNLQKSSCNCSFRRSQIKSATGKVESKAVECMNVGTVSSVIERKNNVPQTIQEDAVENNLDDLAEKMSHNILLEAVQKSSEICISLKDPNYVPLKSQIHKCFGNDASNCCDKVSVEDVQLTVKSSETKFGGYVNPIFIASNDALDLIPSDDTQGDSCDSHSAKMKDSPKKISTEPDHFNKELRDYNANDRNHQTLEEMNAHNKHCNGDNDSNMESNMDDRRGNKKHRKSCLLGTKGYLKKPLLLLIHGAGSNCEVWHNLIRCLVRGGYECVAPDLLGHGLSSAPDTSSFYTFHSYLQDLLFIFDKFVSDGRSAVVLGHGYGCSLAAAIARYRPEQVVQLVLISGGGPTPLAPRTPPSVSPCLRACLEPLLMCGFKRDVVYSVCGKQMEPCSSETSAVPRHIVEHIAQGHIWPEGDAAFHRRIIAPTLLVHGMKDQHITLVQECEMERTIPRSFLEVIPEAGHWAMLETPGHLSHMILCFMDWWAPPNRTQ